MAYRTGEKHMAHRKAHGSQKALKLAEKEELKDWLREMDSWGLHLHLALVKGRAEAIWREWASDEPLGLNWVQHFIEWHPEMHSALGQQQDVQHAWAEHDPES